MISIGDMAPSFDLKDQDGRSHKLSDYLGKWVVLYFYPKDNTPGCTKEACGFRDQFEAYKQKNIIIIGISKDTVSSHARFADRHALPFTLLANPETNIIKKYGVWKKKTMFGKEYYGTKRTTFLIDPQGKISKIFNNVRPDIHAEEILLTLKK